MEPQTGDSADGLALRRVSPTMERQPGDRTPAPGDLSLVQAFVNSFYNLDTHVDEFKTAAGLANWLLRYELITPNVRVTAADLDRVLDVREGLRALLYTNNGSGSDLMAVAQLNRALRGAALFVQFDPETTPDFQSQQRDLDSALALIATIVAVAQLDGRWQRLKACPGRDCGWAFYDHSRNQTSSWCSMSICGQREKARAYRRRRARGGH
jgi:predicted RNA-binding Zn ribbon-like protein